LIDAVTLITSKTFQPRERMAAIAQKGYGVEQGPTTGAVDIPSNISEINNPKARIARRVTLIHAPNPSARVQTTIARGG
jgi:hypothetical protein